ncbi:MAG TPA: DUF881 domain-containing protein [Micromonosporaceae bacterium]|nr:DUF881 domain-containing protein [Micromonosporaceae bacterium]
MADAPAEGSGSVEDAAGVEDGDRPSGPDGAEQAADAGDTGPADDGDAALADSGEAQSADADDAAEPVGAGPDAERQASVRPAWRRVVRTLTRPRVTGANAIIALLVGLLGFALIAQVKSNANESTLANTRPDDLVRILSDLDSRKDRLSTEIASLQETVRQLNSGAAGRQAALDAAARRADELGILAGTLPAQGPGLEIILRPQVGQQMDASVVLNAVEELRGAGAEAMQITGTGGPGVRVVASTSFVEGNGGVTMGGQTLGGALTISVIGDAQTMQTAMSIPGGVVDTVRGAGGTVQIDQPALVRVTMLHQAEPLRYAHPVS